jgi:tRNA threonylcarbamoyl adenosine modification protein YjeE
MTSARPDVTRLIEIEIASPQEMQDLARDLAPVLAAGDVLALSGPLGAGKTAFARALIQTRLAACGRHEEVPSPSYTLVQTYDLGDAELWHVDLYRLGDASELAELGLDDAFGTAIMLIEWPDRLGRLLPARHAAIAFAFLPDGDEARRLVIDLRGPGWDAVEAVLRPRFR